MAGSLSINRNTLPWSIAWLLLCCMSLGCQPSPTNTDAGNLPEACYSPKPGSPLIQSFKFAGAIPQSPHVLRFVVDWEDSNANLRGGSFQFSVDGVPRTLQILPNRLVPNDSSGTFSLSLALSTSDFVESRKVTVSLVIYDKEGLASNQPSMVLEVKKR